MKKFIITLLISHSVVFSQVFWNEVSSPVTTALRCVSNIDGYNAWICGASGVILTTTNNGYNWVNVSGNGIPNNITLISIYGINSSIALTAGYSGSNTFVYRTSNGGVNWIQVFTEANGFINAVSMFNSNYGFMQGDPVSTRWSLWRTTNGGINWDSAGLYLPRAGTEAGWSSSMVSYQGLIWFGTNNTRIYHSTDFGGYWTVQPSSPELNTYTLTIDPETNLIGFAGGTNMLKTTNGGTNWTVVSAPGTGSFAGFAIHNASPLLAAWFVRLGNNNIYTSLNPYTSWSVQYTAPAGTYQNIGISRTFVYNAGLLYAVRSNGGISRGNFFIEGVKIISNEIPADYKLYQNYPNPFNPATRIKFNLPNLKILNPYEVRGALIRIKVYDMLGREVETLVDQITQPGIYEDTWDGSKYPSGVYYYHFSVIDPKFNTMEYSETKKMVLIK